MDGIVYEAIFDNKVDGVFGISLVENPATKEMFIKLSEDEKKSEVKFKTIDEEQRLLVGLALEPNAPVYRNQDGEEFHIIFKEDTIKNLAHNFFIGDHHKTSTIEHDPNEKISGVTFVESWIVADPKRDKSNVYGLEYPEGSWMVTMKVDSDEIWNDYVKTGKVKGFSIDGIVKLKRIENKNKITMSSVLEKLKEAAEAVALAFKAKEEPDQKAENGEETPVQMGEVMMMGGEVIFEYEGETLEPGVNVFAVDKSDPDNKIPVPVGKYELEDGSILVVSEEGVVGEVMPKEEEKPAEEKPAEEPVAATAESDAVQKIQSILIKYQDEMKAELQGLKDELTEMKKSVVEMGEQPISKPKKAQATTELNKTGRLLQQIRNNN